MAHEHDSDWKEGARGDLVCPGCGNMMARPRPDIRGGRVWQVTVEGSPDNFAAARYDDFIVESRVFAIERSRDIKPLAERFSFRLQ